MNRRRLFLAGACLIGATPAAAQPQQPPAIPDWRQSHLEEGNAGVFAMYALAVCARHRRRSTAEALLATPPGSQDERRLLSSVIPPDAGDCPMRTGRVAIPPLLIRGAVAEAIYNGDRLRPRDDAVLPFTDRFEPQSEDRYLHVGRWVAKCAVHRSPRIAHSVLSYNPGAVGERRALVALRPDFAACLPAGERLTVSRLRIRGLIAEALYHASRTFRASFINATANVAPLLAGERL